MKILVINGSPKGAYSVTLQTSLWLEKKHPEHQFAVLHAGQRIAALERDFAPAREAIENADLLLLPTRSIPSSPPISSIVFSSCSRSRAWT